MVWCVEVDRCVTPHRQHSCSPLTLRMERRASHPSLVASFYERLVEDDDVNECVHDSPRIATLPSQWPSKALLTHAARSRRLLYGLRLHAIVQHECDPWIEVVTTTKCRGSHSSIFMAACKRGAARSHRTTMRVHHSPLLRGQSENAEGVDA